MAASCRAQSFTDLQGELLFHDNVTRSERAQDQREDAAIALSAIAGLRLQPGLYTGLTLTGSVFRTQFRRYAGMSSWEAGLGLALDHKFGLGDRQPTLGIELGVARNEFNQGARDAWIYRAGVRLERRVTDSLLLEGGLRYEVRDSEHNVPRDIPLFPRPGNTWDLRTRNLFVAVEQDLGATTWLGATYQYQRGDIASTAVPYPKIFDTATAITPDPVFGPTSIAYRLPAQVHSVALDLNRAIFERGTLYLAVEYQRTDGRNGIDYDTRILRGGFIHGF